MFSKRAKKYQLSVQPKERFPDYYDPFSLLENKGSKRSKTVRLEK